MPGFPIGFLRLAGGADAGIHVVLSVFLVLVISNVLTSTTSPMEITNALESLSSPLKYIGIPTERLP